MEDGHRRQIKIVQLLGQVGWVDSQQMDVRGNEVGNLSQRGFHHNKAIIVFTVGQNPGGHQFLRVHLGYAMPHGLQIIGDEVPTPDIRQRGLGVFLGGVAGGGPRTLLTSRD